MGRVDRIRPAGPPDCPFCASIEAGELLADGGLAVAIGDRFPLNPGHCLVISRRHVADFFDLEAEEQGAVLALVAEMRAVLSSRHHFDGLNVGLNVGAAGGQTIEHAHWHVIPRYRGDVPDPRGGIRWVVPDRAAYWDR